MKPRHDFNLRSYFILKYFHSLAQDLGLGVFFPGGRCFLKNEITHKLRRHADTDSWERNVFSVVLLFFSFFPKTKVVEQVQRERKLKIRTSNHAKTKK